MMTSSLVEASRKAIKLNTWKWIPGMLGVKDCDSNCTDYLHPQLRICNQNDITLANNLKIIPDLDDPATRGAILQLAKNSCRDPHAYLKYYDDQDGIRWAVCSNVIDLIKRSLEPYSSDVNRIVVGSGFTEGEALILALEEAPKIIDAFNIFMKGLP
jgi:hypothetical protein